MAVEAPVIAKQEERRSEGDRRKRDLRPAPAPRNR